MGTAENKATVRSMFIELSKGNAEGWNGALADNARINITGTTIVSGSHSKAEYLAKAFNVAIPQIEGGITLTPDNFIAEGDYVVVQVHGQSKTKAGKPYNNTYCMVFRVANGKVQELTEYSDTELITAAFGK
jgi:ketosteroid isomerase-like protein